jgi:hypothetical protein
MPGLSSHHVLYTRRFHGGILRTEPVNGHFARTVMGKVCWIAHSKAAEHKLDDAFKALNLSKTGGSVTALSKLQAALKAKKR